MNRCKDCKSWIRRPDHRGLCEAVVKDHFEVRNETKAYIVAISAEGTTPQFVTRADFGCELWEAKE